MNASLRDPQSPRWILGLIAIVACFGVAAVALALLGLWKRRCGPQPRRIYAFALMLDVGRAGHS
ncbi:hypothetical protein Pyrfu_1908 [Pyrolobus fumarii 1A]|uniref:Uncharacterized protein n=1 Tax=Pyrolobus fumarii (strain DSM 11204 / 1A) TaxID=694429 RepID=G0ED83_PYRF1|nr:hypothetical protein [Pyrolobus fumarii]AEM39761.1 hypothetical protein Pyrfu_1908 [Pyrolobus fumarii 1A]